MIQKLHHLSAESRRSGVKSRISFCFPHDKPGIDVVIHLHTVNRISRSHANYRFVRDDEGVGDGALLRDKVYQALAGMVPELGN